VTAKGFIKGVPLFRPSEFRTRLLQYINTPVPITNFPGAVTYMFETCDEWDPIFPAKILFFAGGKE